MNRHLKLLLVVHLFLLGSMASVIMDLCQEDQEALHHTTATPDDNSMKPTDLYNPKALEQVRFDIIRSQILHKLKLEKPPCVKKTRDLVYTEQFRTAFEMLESKGEPVEETEVMNKSDSFLVFPNNTDFLCRTNNATICNRFEFVLPPQTEFLTSADLWLYKVSSGYLHVWEPIDGDIDFDMMDDDELLGNERFLGQEPIAKDHPDSEWTRIQLPVNLTLKRLENQIIAVLEVSGAMVEETGAERPFLAVTSGHWSTASRKRRSLDCDDEHASGCCREKLTISFKDIGYDSWIVYPLSYEANYCRGKCVHYYGSSTKQYHSVLFEHLANNASAAERLGFKLCCTPSKMKPLSILWSDSNETIHHLSMPDMIVESCDCA